MKKTLLTTAAATFAVAFSAPAAKADPLTENLIRESHRVEAAADTLGREFRLHFRYSPQFSILMSDAYAIQRRADEIHAMAHQIHSLPALRRLESKVSELDRFVHHVGDQVNRAAYGPRAIMAGRLHHVRRLIATMNSSLHSMKDSTRAMESRFQAMISRHAPGDGHGHPQGNGRAQGRTSAELLRDRVIGEVIRHVGESIHDRNHGRAPSPERGHEDHGHGSNPNRGHDDHSGHRH